MKELKTYFGEIKKSLPCGNKEKKKILRDLQLSVENFLAENPGANFEAVVNHFGTPSQIADTYTEEMPTQELQKKMKTQKWIIGIIAGAVACALLVWGIAVGIALVNEFNRDNGLVVVEQPIEGNFITEIGE